MSNEKLNQVFKLYQNGKYEEAKKINDEVLKESPSNIYAGRYAKMIEKKIGSFEDKKKVTVGGKVLKCPHCLSKIGFSALSISQRKSIKEKNYNNLELKCPYCHTSFVLQKRKANSLFGLKLGSKATINGEIFRLTGYIQYVGKWTEYDSNGNYDSTGPLEYLEWILLGEKDNKMLYFSEGFSSYKGIKEYEYEISEKIKITKKIDIDFDNKLVNIEGNKVNINEVNNVTVKSIYGENSKIFTVGENIELFEFKYKGINYVIERESTGNQVEVGIYQTKNINLSEIKSIFGETTKISKENNLGSIEIYSKFIDFIGKNIEILSVLGIFFFLLIIDGIIPFSFLLYIILFIIVVLILIFIIKEIKSFGTKVLLFGFIIGPILSFAVFPSIFGKVRDTNPVKLSDIKNNINYEIDSNKTHDIVKSKIKYDLGGTKTIYERIKGVKFIIKSKEDKKVLDYIKSLSLKKENGTLNSKESEIQSLFDGKVYPLK